MKSAYIRIVANNQCIPSIFGSIRTANASGGLIRMNSCDGEANVLVVGVVIDLAVECIVVAKIDAERNTNAMKDMQTNKT